MSDENIALGMDASPLVRSSQQVLQAFRGIDKATHSLKAKFNEIIGPYETLVSSMRSLNKAGQEYNVTAKGMLVNVRSAKRTFEAYKKSLIDTGTKMADLALKTGNQTQANKIFATTMQEVAKAEVFLNQMLSESAKGMQLDTLKTKENTRELERNAKAARAAAAAKRQAATRMRQGQQIGGFTAGIQKNVSTGGASFTEIVAYKNAVGQLGEVMRRALDSGSAKLSQMKRIWADLAHGKVRAYQGELRRIQNQMIAVRNATKNLGREAEQNFNRAAEAARRANTRVQRHGVVTKKAGEQGQYLLLTWRSIVRLLSVQVVYRNVFLLASALREAGAAAVDLQIRIAEIQTIDTSRNEFEQWANTLRDLADKWNISLVDQAEAAYQSLSNQVVNSAAEFAVFGEAVNRFATATVSTAADSVNLLSAAINSYHMDVTEAERVSAIFFKTIEQGRVRANEMASTIGTITILASQLNVSLEELGAMIATLTIQGVKYNQASTQLRGIFIKLLKPTKEMKQFFRDIGVESGEAAIKIYGMQGVFRLLIEKIGTSSTELAKVVNRIRGLSGALALTDEGFDIFTANIARIKSAAADYDRAVQLVLKNTGKQLRINMEQIQNFLIQDVMGKFIKDLAGVSGNFTTVRVTIIALVQALRYGLVPAMALVSVALIKMTIAGKGLIAALWMNPATWAIASFTLFYHGIKGLLGKMDALQNALRQQHIAFIQDLEQQLVNVRGKLVQIGKAINQSYLNETRGLQQEVAQRIAALNNEVEAHMGYLEEWGDFFEATQKRITAAVQTMVSNVSAELKNLETAIKQSETGLTGLTGRKARGILEFDLEDIDLGTKAALKSIDDQLKATEKLIEKEKERLKLREQQYGDLPGGTEYFSGLKKTLAEKEKKAQEDAEKRKRETQAKASREAARTLDARLTVLRQQQEEAAKAGDIKVFEKISTELDNVWERRKKIVETYREENLVAGLLLDFRKQWLANLATETKLRGDLKTQQEADLVNLRAHYDALIADFEEMKRLISEITDFDMEVALAGDINALTTAAKAHFDLLYRLQEIRDRLGVGVGGGRQGGGWDKDLEGIVDTEYGAMIAAIDVKRAKEAQKILDAGLANTEQQVKMLTDLLLTTKEAGNAQKVIIVELLAQLKTAKLGFTDKDYKTGVWKAIDRSRDAEGEDAWNNLNSVITGLEAYLDGDMNVNLKALQTGLKDLNWTIRKYGDEIYSVDRSDAPLVNMWKDWHNLFAASRTENQAIVKNMLTGVQSLIMNVEKGGSEHRGLLLQTFEEGTAVLKALKDERIGYLTDLGIVNKTNLNSQQLLNIATNNLNQAIYNLGRATHNLAQTLNNIGPGIPAEKRATGGMMNFHPGSPSGTDTIPAWLSPGERVLSRGQNNFFSQWLRTRGAAVQARHFSGGGQVDVGGINVNVTEANNPHETADIVVRGINRGLRRKLFRLRGQ